MRAAVFLDNGYSSVRKLPKAFQLVRVNLIFDVASDHIFCLPSPLIWSRYCGVFFFTKSHVSQISENSVIPR
jgi:hypothetical protein